MSCTCRLLYVTLDRLKDLHELREQKNGKEKVLTSQFCVWLKSARFNLTLGNIIHIRYVSKGRSEHILQIIQVRTG